MNNIIKFKKDAFEICYESKIESFIKKSFAESLFVKYHWHLQDVDMNKQYADGTEEQALVNQNKQILELRDKSDKDIFIQTVMDVCEDYYCIFLRPSSPYGGDLLFISKDLIDKNEINEHYWTEYNYDIEKSFLCSIDYESIIEDVKNMSEEEIIKKYSVTSYDEEDFFFRYGIIGIKIDDYE